MVANRLTAPPQINLPKIIIRLPLISILILLLPLFCAANSTPSQDTLQHATDKVFNVPVEMGEQLPNLPIWPIFKDSELTGYAFQSVDFVALRGFAGKPINMLIGIDPNGIFKGVQVLEHHEPMFNHDLPGAMQNFVNQYQSLKVTDRVIIDNSYIATPDKASAKKGASGAIIFDGISKATISLAVINKTVFSSALHVARSQLQAYKQKQIVIARPSLYEPMDWPQLLHREFVRKWTITQDRVERRTGLSLEEYQEPKLDLNDPKADFNLYYAYLNAPTIGKNLLGNKGFEELMDKLKPGEHAIGIISEGFYTYPGDHTFTPKTEPNDLYLEQNNLLISMESVNIKSPKKIPLESSTMGNQYLQIFKIPRSANLTPNTPMSLILDMSLALPNGNSIEVRFNNEYRLPSHLFEMIEPPEDFELDALWISIWQSRIPDVLILCLSLIILTVVFLRQQAISKRSNSFHKFRWAFLFFTLFFIGFYAQGQLSVINIYTLLLELVNGFNLEFFLLDPIIFILWTYTAISLVMWGRGLFCGWLCPFGALQEMAAWIAKKLKLKQFKIQPATNKKLLPIKYLILYTLIASAFYSTSLAEKLAEVEPFKTSITFLFIQSWPFVLYALLLLGTGLFIHKFYCRYICPLGAGLAILGQFRRFEWLNRRTECGTPCQVCRHKCGINAIDKQGAIDYNECIQCLECIVIINNDNQCAPSMVSAKKSSSKKRQAISAIEITMNSRLD
jgi:NosR/NirI family nitrous oxide reductase transcriptional regulator